MEIIVIALVFGALAIAQSALLGRLGLRGFSYERRFERRDAWVGDSVGFIEVIRNRGPFLLPWVRVETRVPPSFGFRTREAVDIRGENYHKSVFTLLPFSQVTRRHRVTLHQRGHYALQMASVTAGDLLGMRSVGVDMEAPAEIFVYPELLDRDALGRYFSRAQGGVSVRRWIQPDPFLVNGIRGYRPGDPEHDIHWAATARTGELQVKTHDYTADPRLMVLINGQKTENQWGDLMDYEQEAIERAISLAATLCLTALRQGVEAGFGANLPLDEGEESAYLPPLRGRGREEELLRAFARLRVRRVRRFPTFLEQLPPLPGADYIILSCYDSEEIRQRMAALCRAGCTAELILLPEVPHA